MGFSKFLCSGGFSEQKAQEAKRIQTQFFTAIKEDKVDDLKALLDSGVNPNRLMPSLRFSMQRRSLLWWAINDNAASCVAVLLERGAAVLREDDTVNTSAVTHAITQKNSACLDLLLEHSDALREQSWAYVATHFTCVAFLPQLLTHGLDVNCEVKEKGVSQSMLAYAVGIGASKAVCLLLKMGADCNKTYSGGVSAVDALQTLYAHNTTPAPGLDIALITKIFQKKLQALIKSGADLSRFPSFNGSVVDPDGTVGREVAKAKNRGRYALFYIRYHRRHQVEGRASNKAKPPLAGEACHASMTAGAPAGRR
jgi:ankyrin repeat protein